MQTVERAFRAPEGLSLRTTLGPLRRGTGDPCLRLSAGEAWRATRTPEGPATTHLQLVSGTVRVRAWGPGADWAVEHAPVLVGTADDVGSFRTAHPLVADLHRRHPGLRIPRSLAVAEAAVPSVLEQKVQGSEARRAYRSLVWRYGEPAPGPPALSALRLRLPPAPERLAGVPSYAFHPLGVERKRADTVRLVCRVARQLDATADMAPVDATRRLTAVPGIGAWTAAEIALVALGDADAVPVGDFHLPNTVSWALAGEPRGDDARMLELLEPFRGHRGRVIRLLSMGVGSAPKYGPRLSVHRIAAI
jgi:3-methyladenine DNA glycosylase/8-oxoguanine DNA glycosylase